ncbi:MAG: hypothetical protein JRN20_03170 [Nitrososphaerota archaeon]|nr:hypothetical protein [Nitrososphaerota archaeon]MDG6922988.1 hypothetical protein [Nitrososphaerota archaeon]
MEEYTTLNLETAEMFKQCRSEGFPLCLQRALVGIFNNEDMMVSLAESAGFNQRAISSTHEVWKLYLDLLSSLDKIFGRDSIAVIESKIIEEIKRMHCTECPIFKMELERKERHFMESLPTFASFLLRYRNEL